MAFSSIADFIVAFCRYVLFSSVGAQHAVEWKYSQAFSVKSVRLWKMHCKQIKGEVLNVKCI